MKRIAADRPGWDRILEKRFYCMYLDTPGFKGSIALLCMDKVRDPLLAKSSRLPICIVDNGYSWLQHYPQKEHYTLTTMFDEGGVIVQWYIDICLQHGVTRQNIPWMDDLFLDIIVSPGGEIEMLDFSELQHALAANEISEHHYDLAVHESERLVCAIRRNNFSLFDLCQDHRQVLLGTSPLIGV